MLVVAIGLAGVKRSGVFSQPLFALVLADINFYIWPGLQAL
jgi:hypothetical protein